MKNSLHPSTTSACLHGDCQKSLLDAHEVLAWPVVGVRNTREKAKGQIWGYWRKAASPGPASSWGCWWSSSRWAAACLPALEEGSSNRAGDWQPASSLSFHRVSRMRWNSQFVSLGFHWSEPASGEKREALWFRSAFLAGGQCNRHFLVSVTFRWSS